MACDCSCMCLSDNDVCTFVCMFSLDAILGHVVISMSNFTFIVCIVWGACLPIVMYCLRLFVVVYL